MARRDSTPVRIDGFGELSLLGRGGFSEVYRAQQLDFDRWVAIKVVDVGLDERQRAAFERECRAMGVVSKHPNIVTVLSGAYTDDGRPAIVMELYGGGTYGQRLRAVGSLPPAEVLDLGVRISGALQTAHDHEVVHRDVKPPNLYRSDYDQPALGDFGISTLGNDTGVRGMSIHYAAPEVIEDREPGPSADVYSLAATLYTLVAGRRPFERPGGGQGEFADVALRILRETPPRIGGSCPPGLERVLLRGLSKQPDERPASAAAFGRLLQEVQEQLGTMPTTLAVAAAGRAAPVSDHQAPGAVDADVSATVARAEMVDPDVSGSLARPRSAPDVPSTPDDDPVAAAPRRRRVRSIVIGGLAVVAVVGAAVALQTGQDPAADVAEPPPIDEAVTDDDFFVRVEPPDDVRVVRNADGEVVVTWTPADDLRYELERVDADGADAAVVTTAEGQAVLADVTADVAPCVIVRAISDAGQLSAPSSPACLGAG